SVNFAKCDRCPYPLPFPDDFSDCTSYQSENFDATDSRNKALRTWATCRHLTTGSDVENRGRFYPRCALGSPEERLRNQLRNLVQLQTLPPETTVRPA